MSRHTIMIALILGLLFVGMVVGPAVADFADTVEALKAGDGIIQTKSADLPSVLRQLLESPARRRELADGGRAVIKAHQGATDRHVRLIMSLIS